MHSEFKSIFEMKKVIELALGGIFAFAGLDKDANATPLLFANDAAIVDIGGFHDTECQTEFDAWIILLNAGTSVLTTAEIQVTMNGAVSYSYYWTGSLNPNAEVVIDVGQCSVIEQINVMEAFVINPNGANDENNINDSRIESFTGLPSSGMGITIQLTTDLWPEETSWVIMQDGVELYSSSLYPDLGELNDWIFNFCLPPGCYEFIIYDSFGDGICCNYGEGSYNLWDDNGVLLSSGGDFGTQEITTLCNEFVGIEERPEDDLHVFPNPCFGHLTLEIPGIEISEILIYSLDGKEVYKNCLKPGNHSIDLTDLSGGLYQIVSRSLGSTSTARLKIN